MDFQWMAVAAGAGVGLIVGMTGVGGGSLMTPLLISVFHLDTAHAVGTDLWFAGLTKVSGSLAHHREGHVDYRIAGLLLAGSVPASIVTVAWMHHTAAQRSDGPLAIALGIGLLLTALAIACRPLWQKLGLRLEARLAGRRQRALTVACGALLGVLVALSSIGAGAIGATLILLLYPRIAMRRLVGTDIAHAVPLTLIAGIGHATLGNVEWHVLAELLVGSLPGIWIYDGKRRAGIGRTPDDADQSERSDNTAGVGQIESFSSAPTSPALDKTRR